MKHAAIFTRLAKRVDPNIPILEAAMGEIEVLEQERDHWKANHDTRVEAARLLIERTDMPLERVKAYKRYMELAAQNEALREALEEVKSLIGETAGVYGLHLNGDLSPWAEIEQGGRFERLTLLDDALNLPNIAAEVLKRRDADVREECAKVCEEFDSENPHIGQATAVAAAIRARSNEGGR